MKRNIIALAATAVLVSVTAVSSAQTIYSQGDAGTLGAFADGVAGQFWDQRLADNFTVGSAATVDTITWSGGSENFFGPAGLDQFSAFVVRLYNDAAGSVGSEVWSGTFTTAATNPVFSGNLNVNGGEIYNHSVSTGGVALGAGSYWISIGSVNVIPGDDGYVWADTTNIYDGISAFESPFGSGYVAGTGDFTFGLEGVPEPGTFIAIGAGLVGLLITRRKR